MTQNEARIKLSQGLAAMHIELSLAKQNKLLDFVWLLAKWNKAYNLTAVRDVEQMITLHILDSLCVLPYLDGVTSVLDVGTGAGLPGIPLAIARSDISFKLLDSQQKKINFVQHVITSLQLPNVTAMHQRIESLQVSSPLDMVVSRAFASLDEFVKLVANVCTDQTKIVAMKARRDVVMQEAKSLPNEFKLVNIETVTVPEINAERCLVFLQRT